MRLYGFPPRGKRSQSRKCGVVQIDYLSFVVLRLREQDATLDGEPAQERGDGPHFRRPLVHVWRIAPDGIEEGTADSMFPEIAD